MMTRMSRKNTRISGSSPFFLDFGVRKISSWMRNGRATVEVRQILPCHRTWSCSLIFYEEMSNRHKCPIK